MAVRGAAPINGQNVMEVMRDLSVALTFLHNDRDVGRIARDNAIYTFPLENISYGRAVQVSAIKPAAIKPTLPPKRTRSGRVCKPTVRYKGDGGSSGRPPRTLRQPIRGLAANRTATSARPQTRTVRSPSPGGGFDFPPDSSHEEEPESEDGDSSRESSPRATDGTGKIEQTPMDAEDDLERSPTAVDEMTPDDVEGAIPFAAMLYRLEAIAPHEASEFLAYLFAAGKEWNDGTMTEGTRIERARHLAARYNRAMGMAERNGPIE